MPDRIRLSRARGWRLPENAVSVARPGRWGNPFIVGKDGTRLQCAGKFYVLARGFIALVDTPDVETQLALYRRIRRRIADLQGKDLACWCALDGGACHADVLLCLANPGHPAPAWWPADGIDLGRPRVGMAASDLIKSMRAAAKGKQS
jgi:hypothetical protein